MSVLDDHDRQMLLDGQRLSTEAKVDFFEEMTSIAFQAGAWDRHQAWVFALLDDAGRTLELVAPGNARQLRVPYEIALSRAPDSPRVKAVDAQAGALQRLQDALVQALDEQGIRARAVKQDEDVPFPGRWQTLVLLRYTRVHGPHVIEGQWRLT